MPPAIERREEGGFRVQDPYYDQIMAILDSIQSVIQISPMITIDGETLSALLGEIAAETNGLGIGITVSAAAIAELLVAKLAGAIHQWSVINTSPAELTLETPSPSITSNFG